MLIEMIQEGGKNWGRKENGDSVEQWCPWVREGRTHNQFTKQSKSEYISKDWNEQNMFSDHSVKDNFKSHTFENQKDAP